MFGYEVEGGAVIAYHDLRKLLCFTAGADVVFVVRVVFAVWISAIFNVCVCTG